MSKSEIKAIIKAGGGMSINAEKYTMDELSIILKTTKALVIVEVPDSMTAGEVLRLAKEGSGHVFFTGERMRKEGLTMKQIIANARAMYFDKFVGCKIFDKECREKYQSDWMGMTPDEAMELADVVVDWLYSPHEQKKRED